MKILAAVEILEGQPPVTGAWNTVQRDGARWLVYSTLDDGRTIQIKLDPDEIVVLDAVFGLAVRDQYGELLRLGDGVVAGSMRLCSRPSFMHRRPSGRPRSSVGRRLVGFRHPVTKFTRTVATARTTSCAVWPAIGP